MADSFWEIIHHIKIKVADELLMNMNGIIREITII